MISVLTVNYHSSADVRHLAESLVAHAGDLAIELIVANNSPDDVPSLPPELPSQIIPLANVGYARAINATAKAATRDVWFVANPDVTITAGALRSACEYLAGNPDIGILLPQLVSPDASIQHSVRRFYTWPVALYARLPLRDRISHPKFFRRYLMLDDDLSAPLDVDWGLGGAMFLRRADFPDGRIFDERYFLYFEDVDLCYSTWQRGARVRYNPVIVCQHAHRRGSASLGSTHARHHAASFIRFILKHGGLPQRPVP